MFITLNLIIKGNYNKFKKGFIISNIIIKRIKYIRGIMNIS
jgi:hypothetical protein